MRSLAFISVAFFCFFSFGQEGSLTSDATNLPTQNATFLDTALSSIIPKNGNNQHGQIYAKTACGLGFSMTSLLITRRSTPQGASTTFPVAMTVSSIPTTSTIDQAYLWVVVAWTSSIGDLTATITPPGGTATNLGIMPTVGVGEEKGWSETETRLLRLDLTTFIQNATTKNGSYSLTFTNSGGATVANTIRAIDGATLMVIYRDPYNGAQGNLYIDDGVLLGGPSNSGVTPAHTMTYPAVCGTPLSTVAFSVFSDMQRGLANSNTVTRNIAGVTTSGTGNAYHNFYEFAASNPTIAAGQTSSNFQISSSTNLVTDYYGHFIDALYFSTDCHTCDELSATAFTDPSCGVDNGTITLTSGGCTPTYQYSIDGGSSFQASNTFGGLANGTYVAVVEDGESCRDSVSIVISDEVNCLTLDIDLDYIEVECLEEDQMRINWRTTHETNNDFFTLESSSDGIHFSALETVKGAGTTANPTNYSRIVRRATDLGFAEYLRLKQTDYNGEFTYHGLQKIGCEKTTETVLFPNPTSEKLFVKIADQNASANRILLLDLNGQVLIDRVVVESLEMIDLSQIESGMYVVQLIENGRVAFTDKVVKK